MLMFCSGEVPYSTFTWQYDLFDPAAGMIALVTVLIAGLPASPSAGSVASSVHFTGPEDWGGSFFAEATVAATVREASTAAARGKRAAPRIIIVPSVG